MSMTKDDWLAGKQTQIHAAVRGRTSIFFDILATYTGDVMMDPEDFISSIKNEFLKAAAACK